MKYAKIILVIAVVFTLTALGLGIVLTYFRVIQEASSPPSTVAPAVEDTNIRIFSPKTNDEVVSPLVVRGEARGGWFFEGVFPVKVLDGDGTVVGSGQAGALSEWETQNFVPFRATVRFSGQKSLQGMLVLEKDNPSGLPENAGELRAQIRFKPVSGIQGPLLLCKPTGCSKEVCSDEEVMTPCVYSTEFICYKTALCERQSSGACGWTQTPELISCLGKPQDAN